MTWKVNNLQHLEKVKVMLNVKVKLKVNASMAKSQVAWICMKLSRKVIFSQHLVVQGQGHVVEEMLRKENTLYRVFLYTNNY